MAGETEAVAFLESWQKAFRRAVDFDTWGQPVEAIDVYQRLSQQLHTHASSPEGSLFKESQKTTLENIALCLDSRRKSLQTNASNQLEGISLDDLKRLETTLQNLLGSTSCSNSTQTFPVDLSVASARFPVLKSLHDASEPDSPYYRGKGTLLPKPLPIFGKTLLTIKVDRIGLKDSSQFLDPYLSISVRDAGGKALTTAQDTPLATGREDSIIIFSCNVHIQKTLDSLPPGYAIFFELKHFKPKKAKVSTRCWTFLEQDEVKDGPLALELYKKPTDFHRKNVRLLTVKPLFLHLNLSLLS